MDLYDDVLVMALIASSIVGAVSFRDLRGGCAVAVDRHSTGMHGRNEGNSSAHQVEYWGHDHSKMAIFAAAAHQQVDRAGVDIDLLLEDLWGMLHRGPDNHRENGMGKLKTVKNGSRGVCSTVSLVTTNGDGGTKQGAMEVFWLVKSIEISLHSSIEPCDHVNIKVSYVNYVLIVA